MFTFDWIATQKAELCRITAKRVILAGEHRRGEARGIKRGVEPARRFQVVHGDEDLGEHAGK